MAIFLCADLHFGDRRVLRYKPELGKKQRPFYSTDEMDEALVKNWNNEVWPNDLVIVVGDVTKLAPYLHLLSRCAGKKLLVKGNHDIHHYNEYLRHFMDIVGAYRLNDFMVTHIPIHPCALERWRGNIHGHLHDKRVMRPVYEGEKFVGEEIDPNYFCVSMEQIEYKPIAFDDVQKFFARKPHEDHEDCL